MHVAQGSGEGDIKCMFHELGTGCQVGTGEDIIIESGRRGTAQQARAITARKTQVLI